MSQRITNVEIDSRFKDAYALVNGSLGKQDIAQLDEGVKLMRDTATLCMELGKLEMMADGIRHVRSCVSYKTHIESYRTKKMPESYFDKLLQHFSPYYNDICGAEKSTIDIDEKLMNSFIRLDSTHDYSALMRKFGLAGSRKAFAIALNESFKLPGAGENPDTKQRFSIPLLSVVDAYTPAPTAKACLPDEVLDVLQRHPVELLSQHWAHRNSKQGGYLKLPVLDLLFKRAGADEVFTDVLMEIASNSFFRLPERNHLVWIEEMTGTIIGHETLNRELIGMNKEEDDKIAMLYYILRSPNFPADEIANTLRNRAHLFSAAIHIEAMRGAITDQSESSEAFNDKVVIYIKAMHRHQPDAAVKMLDLPGIPRRRLMDEPALRDLLLAGDLGL